jgi:hypothetical protein
MALQACLRLDVNAVRKEIRCVRPLLPIGVHDLTIRGLWVGSARADLRIVRDNEGVNVRLLQSDGGELQLRVH